MSVSKVALSISIALVLVGITLFFSESPQSLLGKVELEQEANTFPYAVAHNASTQYFDELGQPSYTFKSTKLSHFRPSDKLQESYTTMDSPNIEIFHEQKPWRIRAEKGRIAYDKEIQLERDVVIFYEGIGGELTKMMTPKLIFNPTEKMAHTNEAVTIISPLGTMTATGMIADLSTRKIKLLRKVKGQHTPTSLIQ